MKKTFLIPLLVVLLNSCTNSAEQALETTDFEPTITSGDVYSEHEENSFINTTEQPVSTFSIDADGASYSNIRRFIMQENTMPPKGAIRTEELINYFDLGYAYDKSNDPIALNGEVSSCPWNSSNKLVRIGIKGKPIPEFESAPNNFVFLIDVSGSMSSIDKLELLKTGFKLLVDEMNEKDRIAIVTYAGNAGVLLNSTPCNQKQKIKDAINSLGSGGSTAGAQGIITAYEIAESNLIANGNNRIILGTDGDFNVGISNQEDLVKLIEEKRDFGVFLTVLGVGRGNLNDAALEQIANNGNGTYEYIDHVEQLKKVFIYEKSKFFTVAKDVKVQVKFNPDNVKSYRLIGYENRVMDKEDFNNDKKDAGEIGANQDITAIYEIIPKDVLTKSASTFTIDIKYKEPNSDISKPLQLEIFDEQKSFEQSSGFMKFTAAVAAYSMLLNDSKYKGNSNYSDIIKWLDQANLSDNQGLKKEFKDLVDKTKRF